MYERPKFTCSEIKPGVTKGLGQVQLIQSLIKGIGSTLC